MFGRTIGPAELIFGHKMYLWCHSDLGYLKIQNSKILAPCWEFLIFAKNQEILIFRKSGQKGAVFVKSPPNKKDRILGPHGLCMQKIRIQKPSKRLAGIFFYLPILLYNTIWIFLIAARAQTWGPDRRSGGADFWTQNVFKMSLRYRLYKKSKFQNLDPLLRNCDFCQKSGNHDF